MLTSPDKENPLVCNGITDRFSLACDRGGSGPPQTPEQCLMSTLDPQGEEMVC